MSSFLSFSAAIVQDPNILQQIEDYGIVLGDKKKKYEPSLEEKKLTATFLALAVAIA